MQKMKKGLYVLFLFTINFLGAQKIVKKSIINPNTLFIQIDVSNCYEASIETSDSNEMVIEATIEGEYKNDLLLNIREEGATASVNIGFHPNYVNPNDKLAAHKVISVALHIKVPEHKSVQVYGSSCNLMATGFYKNLKVTLADGRCTLNDVSETVNVATHSGDINATCPNAEIFATSEYGKILRQAIPKGDNRFVLTTVTGNIHLRKKE